MMSYVGNTAQWPRAAAQGDGARLRSLFLWLVGLGLYLPIWANYGGVGKGLQVGYLLFWTVVIVGALFGSGVTFSPPTAIETMYFVLGLLSTIVTMVLGDGFGMLYSTIFLITIAQVYLLVRLTSLSTLLDVATYVMLASLLTCMVVDVGDLAKALSAVVSRNGLFRFTPLDNHPNLTGFVFGGAAILFARKAMHARGARLAGWTLCAVISVMFVFAASARAALLALVLTGTIASYFFRVELRRVLPYILTAITLLFIVVLAVGFDKIGHYLDSILEFSSNTRGIGSGGTGRFELWARSLAALASDPVRMTFGRGLRSSDSLGFSVESSYLVIALDSGVVLAGLLMVFLVFLIFSPSRWSEEKDFDWRCFKTLLIYASFQSIFNRYFLALGNPLSLTLLCLVNSAYLAKRDGLPTRAAQGS